MPEKVSESQVVFERAIHHHVSNALHSQLEKIDEFQLGAVLVRHEKPHSVLQFWKKNELDFTGLPFQKLIQAEDASGLPELQTQTEVIFTATDDHSTRKVDINLNLDGEMKVAYLKFGGDLGGDAKKTVSIQVSLGALKHITSNMYDILTGQQQLRVDPNHPVVKDAMDKGKTFFIINSVYQSDKVDIKITEAVDVGIKDKDTEGTDHGTANTSGATPTTSDATPTTNDATTNDATPTTNDTKPEGATNSTTEDKGVVDAVEKVIDKTVDKEVSAGGDETAGASADSTSLLVTNRDIPTNIAFHVIKVDIGKNGVLMPQGKSGFTHSVKIHFPYGDTFAQVTPDEPSTTGGATGGATPTEKTSPEHTETKDKPEEPKDDAKKEEPSEDTQPKEDPKKDETPKQETDDDTKDTAAPEQ